ncbi:MAG: PulJ/GspJ family protein [Caldicoprobacterales bacterium]|jgi:hypothetical protein|nr:hypothetical protein [Clostridiales bacterium]
MIRKGRSEGFSLMELVLSLGIMAILISSFFGIMTSFAKSNQISYLYLTTGINAGNIYEKAKSMSVYELSAFTSNNIMYENNIKYVVEADWYTNDSSANQIVIVVHQDSSHGFLCYAFGDSIHNLFTMSGQGSLEIRLIPGDKHTTIAFSDELGNTAEYSFVTSKAAQILRVLTNKMNAEQRIHIDMAQLPENNWNLHIYEHPFAGNISINVDSLIIYTKQLNKPIQVDNLTLTSTKSKTGLKIPVYMQVRAYQEDRDYHPISQRFGVFLISP